MPVPTTINDLDTDESLNSPLDSEMVTPTTRPSDYLRAHGAIIKQLSVDSMQASTLAASGGSALVGFIQTGTGAVARTANAKMRDVVSVFDFMTTAQIADVQAGTALVDVTAALQAAINHVSPLGGHLYMPAGKYKITSPLVINDVSIRLEGARRGHYNQFADTGGTTIYLVSATVGDYALKLTHAGAANYKPVNMVIQDIEFLGTNTANNQGGVLVAGRFSAMTIERCTFGIFTGYAIGHDPAASSYVQNTALRDLSFFDVGGCYGLISEPAASAAYHAGTLLTIDNVNLDTGINVTDPKPYIWDFRANRNINAGIFLNEGNGRSVTAVMAFATEGQNVFANCWSEWPSNPPTYFIAFLGDATNQFYGSPASVVRIHELNAAHAIRFESSTEHVISIDDWGYYAATSTSDIVSFAGNYGRCEIGLFHCKTPFLVPDNLLGRLSMACTGDDSNNKVPIVSGSSLIYEWNANDGDLLTADGVNVALSGGTFASNAIEADGTTKVHRFTSNAGESPVVYWDTTLPTSFYDSIVTWVIRYKFTKDAADSATVCNVALNVNLGDVIAANQTVQDGYATAVITGRYGAANYRMRSGFSGTTPTVAIDLRIAAVKVYVGMSSDLALNVAKA